MPAEPDSIISLLVLIVLCSHVVGGPYGEPGLPAGDVCWSIVRRSQPMPVPGDEV